MRNPTTTKNNNTIIRRTNKRWPYFEHDGIIIVSLLLVLILSYGCLDIADASKNNNHAKHIDKEPTSESLTTPIVTSSTFSDDERKQRNGANPTKNPTTEIIAKRTSKMKDGGVLCSICSDGAMMTFMESIVPENTVPFIPVPLQCGLLQTTALESQYTQEQCDVIHHASTIPSVCGCPGQDSVKKNTHITKGDTPPAPITTEVQDDTNKNNKNNIKVQTKKGEVIVTPSPTEPKKVEKKETHMKQPSSMTVEDSSSTMMDPQISVSMDASISSSPTSPSSSSSSSSSMSASPSPSSSSTTTSSASPSPSMTSSTTATSSGSSSASGSSNKKTEKDLASDLDDTPAPCDGVLCNVCVQDGYTMSIWDTASPAPSAADGSDGGSEEKTDEYEACSICGAGEIIRALKRIATDGINDDSQYLLPLNCYDIERIAQNKQLSATQCIELLEKSTVPSTCKCSVPPPPKNRQLLLRKRK